MDEIPLLACPFCGNKEPRILSNGIGDFYVMCESNDPDTGCGARTSDANGRAFAAQRWNARTTILPLTKIPGLFSEIQCALNRYSKENGSNTPDFILAEYLLDCLRSFDKAVNRREEWYGRVQNGVSAGHPDAPKDHPEFPFKP